MKISRILLTGAAAILVIGLAGFLWIWAAPCVLGGCAPLDDLAQYQAEGSELLDAEGAPFAHLATVNRRIVSIDSLPEHVPQAFIAIEDRRFYRHGGVDVWRTAGALLENVRSGQVSEGGSTITQQLARNLFPEWLPYQQRNLRRKVLEARVARQMERTFTKEKILELYLNHIYLGSGAYGIEAAAITYFGKPASELTLAEAAALAGVPQSPSQVNPKEDAERTQARRNLVLDAMVEVGYIDRAAAEEAKAEPIVLATREFRQEGLEGSYFVERVRRELEERVGSRFYTAGLKIYTTLDRDAQMAAEAELARQLAAIEAGRFGTYRHPTYANREPGKTDYLQGAVIVLDAEDGAVRALIGGRDFQDSKFDRATQALRQPGSAFKPFVYAAALERYGSPVRTVDDSPVTIQLSRTQEWTPRNYTGEYDGPITLRDALARSKNVATVRLAQEVGISSAVRLARSLGVSGDIPEVPATALGAADVRPIELVAAYAAFANGGSRVEPYLITRIVDRHGQVLWEAHPRRDPVLDPAVAFVLTSMLRDVVDRGTGSIVRSIGFRGPAAGKTGTTNDASDAWFIGYTPELVAGVWIGLDRPATIVRGASGGTLAAPVWARMMRSIYSSRPGPGEWRMPSGVVTAEVDAATGSVVSPECPPLGETYTEYFVRTAPPRTYCPRYEPLYTWSDSLWVDEEWSDFDLEYRSQYDTLDLDWPELEALRRRAEMEAERRSDEAGRPLPEGTSVPGDTTGAGPGDPPPGTPRPPAPEPAGGGNAPPAQPDPEDPPRRDPPPVLGVPSNGNR